MRLIKQFLQITIELREFVEISRNKRSDQPLRGYCFRGIICIAFSATALTACSPQRPETQSDLILHSENQAGTAGEQNVMKFSNVNEQQIQFRQRWFSAFNAYHSVDTPTEIRQRYVQDLITLGRTDIPIRDGIIHPSQSICVRNQDNGGRNAIDTILTLAEDRNVIIINEDHTMPRDRAFILDLLVALRSRGFTHYAAETFSKQAIKSASPYILVGDGSYTNEPIFGRLATKAKTLGYKLVAYEMTMEQMLAPSGLTIEEIMADSELNLGEILAGSSSIGDQIEMREVAQSENLIKNLLGEAPEAKVIVHVGHSHASEITEGGHLWMAARLKDKTGIDPLTISQTLCQSDGTEVYVATNAINREGASQMSFTDLLIAHPPLAFEKHRPVWRRDLGDKEVNIPQKVLSATEPILIEVRTLEQPVSAVPVERLLVRPEEHDIPLLLPPGEYRIEAFNSNGKLTESERIAVK